MEYLRYIVGINGEPENQYLSVITPKDRKSSQVIELYKAKRGYLELPDLKPGVEPLIQDVDIFDYNGLDDIAFVSLNDKFIP